MGIKKEKFWYSDFTWKHDERASIYWWKVKRNIVRTGKNIPITWWKNKSKFRIIKKSYRHELWAIIKYNHEVCDRVEGIHSRKGQKTSN